MRDIFTEIFENQPLDPMESARKGGRPTLRKRFYRRAQIGEKAGEGTRDGFPILLDETPVIPVYTYSVNSLRKPYVRGI